MLEGFSTESSWAPTPIAQATPMAHQTSKPPVQHTKQEHALGNPHRPKVRHMGHDTHTKTYTKCYRTHSVSTRMERPAKRVRLPTEGHTNMALEP